jgi:hypothetical protein
MPDLLTERDLAWARMIGTAANLASHLSGGMTGNLVHAMLQVEGSRIRVALDAGSQDLMSDSVLKRAEGLGETFKAFLKTCK